MVTKLVKVWNLISDGTGNTTLDDIIISQMKVYIFLHYSYLLMSLNEILPCMVS